MWKVKEEREGTRVLQKIRLKWKTNAYVGHFGAERIHHASASKMKSLFVIFLPLTLTMFPYKFSDCSLPSFFLLR